MKRNVEICYSNSAKINMGNYNQEAPFYSAKTILELDDVDLKEISAVEKMEFNRLRGNVDDLLNAQVSAMKLSLAGIRFRIKDGVRCPSVTSILSKEIPIDKDLLEKYAIRGRELESVVKDRISSGEWREPEGDIHPLKWADIKYKEFFESTKTEIEWDFAVFNFEVFNLNKAYAYSGEVDCYVPINGIPTILDFKTGSYDLRQLVAYAKAMPDLKDIDFKPQQVAIADLKKGKLDKVTALKDCRDHWESFLIQYGSFQQKYSL